MAFDNPERMVEDDLRDAIRKLCRGVAEISDELAALREAVAPMLEEHQLRMQQRAEMQQALRQTQVYTSNSSTYAITDPVALEICDCSPSRTAALAGQFNDWLRDEIARYNKTNRTP